MASATDGTRQAGPNRPRVPATLLTATAWAGCLIVLGAVLYFLIQLLTLLLPLVVALIAAMMLTALFHPVATGLCRIRIVRWQLPSPLAAALTVLLLLGGLAAALMLIYTRFISQLPELRNALTTGLFQIREYLEAYSAILIGGVSPQLNRGLTRSTQLS